MARTKNGKPLLTPAALREIRPVEVLVTMGTDDARAALDTLAMGSSGMRLTKESAAALRRLGK